MAFYVQFLSKKHDRKVGYKCFVTDHLNDQSLVRLKSLREQSAFKKRVSPHYINKGETADFVNGKYKNF